jgi:hypothetical protein
VAICQPDIDTRRFQKILSAPCIIYIATPPVSKPGRTRHVQPFRASRAPTHSPSSVLRSSMPRGHDPRRRGVELENCKMCHGLDRLIPAVISDKGACHFATSSLVFFAGVFWSCSVMSYERFVSACAQSCPCAPASIWKGVCRRTRLHGSPCQTTRLRGSVRPYRGPPIDAPGFCR